MSAQKGIGRLIQIGLKKEGTRGTAESSAAYWNPWSDLTLDEKKEFAADDQSYGRIEDNVAFAQVKKWAQGALTGIVGDQTIGLILYSLFGGYGVSGPSDSAYTHTFTIAQSAQHQSLTLFKHDPLAAADYSYANGVVEKLDLDFALKQFVKYTASILSLSGAAQSTFTPSTTTENRFLPQYIAAKFAGSYGGVTGSLTATGTASSTVHVTACSINPQKYLKVGMTVTGTNIPANTTVAKIVSSTAYDLSQATSGAIGTQTFGPVTIKLRALKLSFNQNVEAQEVLGSVSPADFLNKEFSIDGSFEAILQNESDFKDQFMLPTPLAVRFDVANSDVLIGTSSTPELYIDLASITLQEYGTPYKVGELVYQQVKFKASYSLADTLLGKAVLVNSVSTF